MTDEIDCEELGRQICNLLDVESGEEIEIHTLQDGSLRLVKAKRAETAPQIQIRQSD